VLRGADRRCSLQHRGHHGVLRSQELLARLLRGGMRRDDVSTARDLVSTRGDHHGDVRHKFHHGLSVRSARTLRLRPHRRRQRTAGRLLRLATPPIRHLYAEEQKHEQLLAEEVGKMQSRIKRAALLAKFHRLEITYRYLQSLSVSWHRVSSSLVYVFSAGPRAIHGR